MLSYNLGKRPRNFRELVSFVGNSENTHFTTTLNNCIKYKDLFFSCSFPLKFKLAGSHLVQVFCALLVNCQYLRSGGCWPITGAQGLMSLLPTADMWSHHRPSRRAPSGSVWQERKDSECCWKGGTHLSELEQTFLLLLLITMRRLPLTAPTSHSAAALPLQSLG